MVHLSDISWDRRGEEAIQDYRKGRHRQGRRKTPPPRSTWRGAYQPPDQGLDDSFAGAVKGVKRGSRSSPWKSRRSRPAGSRWNSRRHESFIPRSDLSARPRRTAPERFQVGDKVTCGTNVDQKTRKLGLSIKAREIAEEKDASSSTARPTAAASLGDILGAALKGWTSDK